MKSVYLKKGRERSLVKKHPWVFSMAINRADDGIVPGESVKIIAGDGICCGTGAYSPASQIALRLWSFHEENINENWILSRLKTACDMREYLFSDCGGLPDACRLINAESDGLPGLTVDKYSNWLVCQIAWVGAEYWKQVIYESLQHLFPGFGIYERSDIDIRAKEGLDPVCGLVAGTEPPEDIRIREGGLEFSVDIRRGNKTGFYLDQRENRLKIGRFSRNADVLNCFSYTGGFGVHACLHGAATVINIDTSDAALALSEKNFGLNKLPHERVQHVRGDVFAILRSYRDMRKDFDLIVLDPPKFADAKAGLNGACRGYKDINLLALKLLRKGGCLFTFSCSGLVTMELFRKIVAGAALDAGCTVKVLDVLWQAPDHPWALNFPEGLYLKGFICLKE